MNRRRKTLRGAHNSEQRPAARVESDGSAAVSRCYLCNGLRRRSKRTTTVPHRRSNQDWLLLPTVPYVELFPCSLLFVLAPPSVLICWLNWCAIRKGRINIDNPTVSVLRNDTSALGRIMMSQLF